MRQYAMKYASAANDRDKSGRSPTATCLSTQPGRASYLAALPLRAKAWTPQGLEAKPTNNVDPGSVQHQRGYEVDKV